MKTNIEKAKAILNEYNFLNSLSSKSVIYDDAMEAIKIAAEPDWYYPEKNELPKKPDYYLVVLNEGKAKKTYNHQNVKIDFWNTKHFEIFSDYVIAWTYLPTFNPKKP